MSAAPLNVVPPPPGSLIELRGSSTQFEIRMPNLGVVEGRLAWAACCVFIFVLAPGAAALYVPRLATAVSTEQWPETLKFGSRVAAAIVVWVGACCFAFILHRGAPERLTLSAARLKYESGMCLDGSLAGRLRRADWPRDEIELIAVDTRNDRPLVLVTCGSSQLWIGRRLDEDEVVWLRDLLCRWRSDEPFLYDLD